MLRSTPAHGPSQDLNRQPSRYRRVSLPLSQRREGVSASPRLHTAVRRCRPIERSAGLRKQTKVPSSCTRSHLAAVWTCAPPDLSPLPPPPSPLVYLLTHLHPFCLVNSFHWLLSFSFLCLISWSPPHTYTPFLPPLKREDWCIFFCTVDFVFVKYD